MIGELIGDWIKGILIDGIMGNLSGLFSTVNTKVGEIASDVGTTPQAWNSGIFNMLQSLSDTVIVPIAAAILAVIMCYWTRGNAEICLLAKRGKPKRRSAGVHQFIISPVEEHSKKPDVTRDKIIELAGDLPRVELFARQKAPGWDVWGNEVDSDLSLTPQENVSETR